VAVTTAVLNPLTSGRAAADLRQGPPTPRGVKGSIAPTCCKARDVMHRVGGPAPKTLEPRGVDGAVGRCTCALGVPLLCAARIGARSRAGVCCRRKRCFAMEWVYHRCPEPDPNEAEVFRRRHDANSDRWGTRCAFATNAKVTRLMGHRPQGSRPVLRDGFLKAVVSFA